MMVAIVQIPTGCPPLNAEQLAELAERAACNPGVLLTIESEVVLSLLWGYADGQGSVLQDIVDMYGSAARDGRQRTLDVVQRSTEVAAQWAVKARARLTDRERELLDSRLASLCEQCGRPEAEHEGAAQLHLFVSRKG